MRITGGMEYRPRRFLHALMLLRDKATSLLFSDHETKKIPESTLFLII